MADAYNNATPADGDFARFAAQELRAIKARMDAMSSLSSGVSGLFAARNRAINPEFQYDQTRETGTVYPSNTDIFDIDGWKAGTAGGGGGTFSRQRFVDPTDKKGTRVAITTVADAVIAAAEAYYSYVSLEGLMVRDFLQGTALATGFTVSFRAKASIAGNYSIAFQNAAFTRSYVAIFNVAAANTEQLIIVNVPGDTAGVWNGYTSTAIGLIITFDHGTGTNFTAPLLNQWQAGNYFAAAGTIPIISTLASNFSWKDFQVEKGLIISPNFEIIMPDDQLRYCQRYYEKSYDIGTAVGTGVATGATGVSTFGGGALTVALTGNYKIMKRAAAAPVVYNYLTGAAAQMRDTGGGISALSLISAGQTSFLGTNATVLGANQVMLAHWTVDSRL